jgi:hypothetical protein
MTVRETINIKKPPEDLGGSYIYEYFVGPEGIEPPAPMIKRHYLG